MSRITAITLALYLITGLSCYAQLSEKDRAFIEKYSVDKSIQALLDAHVDEIKQALKKANYDGKSTHFVWTFDWLPGYFVKANIARIYGMEKMNRAIKKLNLDLISVPEKKLYHIKGQPDTLTNRNYLVIIKKVETGVGYEVPLSLRQVKQLCALIRETSYVSMTRTNYIRLSNEKLCIIDTESTYDPHALLKGFMRLIRGYHDLNTGFTEEALKYLFKEIFREIANKPKSELGYDTREMRDYIMRYNNPRWDFPTYFRENYPFA